MAKQEELTIAQDVENGDNRALQKNNIDTVLMAAVEKGQLDPDALNKLVDLKMKIMDREAEMAFNRAMMKFQTTCESILRTKEVKGRGSFAYRYAPLEVIARVIRPALQECQLMYRFSSDDVSDKKQKIICTVSHVDGHSESASVTIPLDSSSQMNDIQKSGSAVSYGKRYALTMALGLTMFDDDDDGRKAGTNGELINEEQKKELKDAIGSQDEKLYNMVLDAYQISTLDELKQADFVNCKNRIEKYKANKKK